MKAIIACETSGATRRALRKRGVAAVSCDLLPSDDDSPHHIIGDARDVLDGSTSYDLVIAHPPCTYLSASGLHWNLKRPERAAMTEDALDFVRFFMGLPMPHAIENPVGCISSRVRKPDQIIQPYMFGDDASKTTCLWLKGLPTLVIDPAARCPGRMVTHNGKTVERWANQTDSGQNRLPPSADRWKLRSVTYPGFAASMAIQWIHYLTHQVAA